MIKAHEQKNHKLWLQVWKTWDWAFTIFFGAATTMLLTVVVTTAIATNIIYQVAYYLATSPAMVGLPFQARLAIMGGGLFLVLAFLAAVFESWRYFYIRPKMITHQDLDMQLTAIMHEVIEIRERVSQ